ncbi:uncharacterized protein LOC144469267 isoform X2 [Augochlora pura]
MSASGFRGRGLGPRGTRSIGPSNGFSGPRFPHPTFNGSRPPQRLPGSEKWVEAQNFVPWQQNKNFIPRSQYRAKLPFRPNSRGRAINSRGIVRFSGPGRPLAHQFCKGFARNSTLRTSLPQEEQIEEKKSVLVPQIPLLGSEEERQQKITETADKLKQKLSSITEEDLTNFWEDDLSFLPNNNSEKEISSLKKGIPELKHDPPELDLTFTDFRDIGRVDCNNPKFDRAKNRDHGDDIIIAFESKATDKIITENDDVMIINESDNDSLNVSKFGHSNNHLNQSNTLLESDGCQDQMFHELSNSDCNLQSIDLQSDNISEYLQRTDTNTNTDLNLDENIRNVSLIQPINDLINENSLVSNDLGTIAFSESILNDRDVSQADLLENQSAMLNSVNDAVTVQDTNVDATKDDHLKNQTPVNTSDSTQTNLRTSPSPNEEIPAYSNCDSKSSISSSYDELHKSCNLPGFQLRLFNVPPRFSPRIPPGPRCRWTFQEKGKNLFFRGPQRLPFHGNRMPPTRHTAPFETADMSPVTFGSCGPQQFTHNVPVSSHDSQHHALVPFSSSDLPPAFDPSEPPPNIRSMSVTESSTRQEATQSRSLLDTRSQITSVPSNNLGIMQSPLSFDLRGPPPGITLMKTNEKLLDFDPQQPPPKIHKRDELLQPPPIFDPRLSSQERSKLIAPLNASGSHMIANFSQPPPFVHNLPINYQPVLPQANNGQTMLQDFVLPPPPMNIADVPPPPLQEVLLEKDSSNQQGISMDDGLEDMQEAMEFAKQIMNMSEEMKSSQGTTSALSEAQYTPSEIPVPKEDVLCISSANQQFLNCVGKKQKKKKKKKKENKSKKGKPTTISELEHAQKPEENDITDEEHSAQNKTIEDVPLTIDQIRPKVIFNLSSKTKVLQKPEEWHRPSVNISKNREISQQVTRTVNSQRERRVTKKHLSEHKRNNQTKTHQKEHGSKINWIRCANIAKTPISEKSNDMSYNKDQYREKPGTPSLTVIRLNNIGAQKGQNPKKENRKLEAPTSELSWKNRVINRFLKMSKNDICNMVNNSSLRKFDIAMKHLVKERRSSLSLKMRNTEDEKMKEYDREEFMNQLNAMLDPGAVVGITDLPTEFIHHLSEVLQLDPMPPELGLSEKQKTNIDEVRTEYHTDNSRMYNSEYFDEKSIDVQSFDYQEQRDSYIEQTKNKSLYMKEEPSHYSLTTELTVNPSREKSLTSSSRQSPLNKSNTDVETMCKKQQPLFNEADLDDILSQVTERTRSLPNVTSKKFAEMQKLPGDRSFHPETEAFERNTFVQISNATAADLDDIFSAGIARAKSLGKNVGLDISRARKSSSEDRNTFRSERYERWSRKERDDLDSFRNLTKEEWEAKYGTINASLASDSAWKTASNSAENLSRTGKSYCNSVDRYCPSDSPTRNLSLSPVTHDESPLRNQEKHVDRYSEIEESRRMERSESSNDHSTSSSSDTDEETVATNVTKLLKVIKEKEKIAKKRSLNETIRDEVTAEIEKKWKEKNKYQEHKSRKRERRKRDRKEKRKREKKRRRKSNSHSNTSRSSEYSEEFRLLAEDEIKKEVTIKEEPLSTFEDSISQGFNNESNKSCVDPIATNTTVETNPWLEFQSLEVGKQQVPAINSDNVSLQPKKKLVTVSVVLQPKTKAQLKQMPDPNESEQNQIVEKSNETDDIVGTGSVTVTDVSKTKENVEEPMACQLTETNKEFAETPLYTNNAPLQVVEELSANVIGYVNVANTSDSCTHLTIDAHTANRLTEQKSTGTVSSETRSGYKKIDIKAYKERALQKRLQEEAKLKDNFRCTVPTCQEMAQSSSINQVDSEIVALRAEKEVKMVEAGNDGPPKDPRLTKIKSSQSVSSSCIPSYKIVNEKTNFEEEHQCVDISRKSKELFISVQRKVANESSETRIKVNLSKDPVQPKNHKNDDDPASLQERIVKRETENLNKMKISTKTEVDEKRFKKLSMAEYNKFKNIRSEGSKELKLRKEKKSTERKTTKSKVSTKEKDLKHPQKTEQIQKSITITADNIFQVEAEKINNNDTSESLQSRASTMLIENLIVESYNTSEINKEHVGTNSTTEEDNNEFKDDDNDNDDDDDDDDDNDDDDDGDDDDDDDKGIGNQQDENSVNKKVVQLQQVDQEGEGAEIRQKLLFLDIEQNNGNSTEINSIQCQFSKELKGDEAVVEQVTVAKNLTSVLHDYGPDIYHLKKINCFNNGDDLRRNTVDNNTILQENKSNHNLKADSLYSNNLETEIEGGNQDNSKSIVQTEENMRTLRINKVETSEIPSPDSSGSPFKGFFAECIEGDLPQESQLCKVQMKSGDRKESSTKDFKQCFEVGTNDQPNVKKNKMNNDDLVEEIEDSDGITLTRRRSSIEEQPGTIDINVVDKIRVNKVETSEIQSPDSSGSPFKGFFVESIEGDLPQESQLCTVQMKTGDRKKSSTKDFKQCFEVGTNDQPNVKKTKMNNDDLVEEIENSVGITLTRRRSSIEKQPGTIDINVVDKIDANNSYFLDTIEADIKQLKTEHANTLKGPETDVISHNRCCQDLVSRDKFDEGEESFIVLDEYIHDTEGRSLEKLNHYNLDLEECIARDTNTVVNTLNQGEKYSTENFKSATFDSTDLKELSDFDKSNGASVGIQNKMKTNLNEMSSESLEEEISKVTDVPSDLNKTSNVEVDEIESLERSKLAIPTDKEDFPTCSRRDAPVAEDIPRQYSLHKISHSAKTVSVAAFKENIKSPESNGEPNSCDKNNVKKQNKVKIISISSNASKMSVVQDVSFNIATEQEKLHKVRDTIQTTDAGRTNQKEENEALHKLKDKPKMKYKLHKKHSLSKNQIKEAVAADTVKLVSAKEAIMNRMIEIDVEIHKLMTEKMTLYQMLTSDALPMGNDVEQNDTIRDDKESKKTLVRPRTPSALMSQLIQNIETEPVSNQCAKTTAENALLKDSTVNSVQINKSKTYGYEQHFEKITNNVSTCSSENEEAVQHRIGSPREFSPSAKKKRHHGPERAVKWDNEPESMKDMLYNDTEGKQANNVIKPILKKVCSTRESTEKDTSLAQTSEVKSRKSCGNMSTAINSKAPSHNGNLCTFNEEENEKTEFRNFANEFNKTEASEQSQNKILDDANDANTSSPTKEKTQENRTPDRSSIYSDDSTWDSLPQVASDDQRKHGTGLALLEETYRKEMAKTRKMKAETRMKKKKKETRAPFQSAVPLTSEEEELPLSALYVKKLHANKKDNMVDQPQERANNDQRVWKNVVEVINAVAENRLGDLSMKNPVKRLGEDSRINVPDANDTSIIKEKASGPKSNIEPKQTIEESREIVVSVPLTSIEDNCTQHTKMSTCFDDQIYACNYARITPSLNKILVLANNGEQLEQSVMNTELQNEETLSATSTNTVNVTSESVSQSAENRNLEISQITFNSAAGSVETGVNDVLGDQCLNTSEVGSVNVDRTEEIHMDDNSKEFILRAEVVGIHKITFVNPEETVTLSDVPNRNDNATAETGDSNLTTRSHTPACNLNKNSNYEYEQANKELFVNTSLYQQVCCDKEGAVDNPEHLISLADDKMTKKRRESERSNKSLSEENNNRNRTPVSILVDVAEALQNDEASNRKPKRKRGSSRIPLRRSSRYTEEVMKRIKLEIDTSVQSTEQESSERNIQTPFSSISPTSLSSYDEDTESVSSNGKKSRNYKTTANKKRSTQSDIEILSSSSPSSEDLKDIVRRCKQQHTMPEMMNCKVRLVDSKHTILKPNVDPNVLRKYGISTINLFVQSAPNDRTSHPCIMMESMAKDLKRVASTLTTELSQCHMSKLLKKTDDATRSIDHLASFNKVRRGPRSMKMNFLANDKETTNSGDDPSVEVMQISTKEQVVVDISQGRGKPDVEIVEEKTTVTKSQHQNDSESILAVIETKDDKEIPRTQYTVHKGPILDIKVFEKSFLAASEDGRIYRYSQASNGILNIYKGHKAAVTCLYVYNSNSTDVNKEWMFSGSLDGTLRCYNITTGVQLRDTADIGSPIQCMDEAWGIIFIGTKSGHVSRYHIKSGVVKGNSIQFSDQSVLALKATNEGPRRVLIVASRSQPITIRDAQTGLFLRTISGEKSHTVYSLMRDHNLIYCGTSTTSILVFDFTNGEQIAQHDAGVGIVCMRLYKKLLFAGCYDGNIYIFDTKDDRLICSIPGPGNMLLSMEVIDNKIIAGSKDKRLQLWQMTRQVRALL